MADLGVITGVDETSTDVRYMAFWKTEVPQSARANTRVDGSISGVIKEVGVVAPYAMVELHYRSNGNLISRTRADASGNYSFTHLDPSDTNGYYVTAFSEQTYNAVTFDKLTPG